MLLYHLTVNANAQKIMRDGFQDSTNRGMTGVWFAVPAIWNYYSEERGMADTAISVEVPDEVAKAHELDPMEGVPEALRKQFADYAKGSAKEYCIPADTVNEYRDTFEVTKMTPPDEKST